MEDFVMHRKIHTLLLCSSVLVAMAGCASTPTRESTGELLDDSAITSKVKADILKEPSLKVSEISVKTFKGEVQLSGFVDSEAAIYKAIEIAWQVRGVKGVDNDMSLKVH
jgi:osmotically-inducible protein OsmY